MKVVPLGDRALRIALPEDLDRAALVAALRRVPGVLDACATESAALVVHAGAPPSLDAVLDTPRARDATTGTTHEIPIVLDGPDLTLALAAGFASEAELARALEAPLEVSFLGFCPGFAYLRGLDPRLAGLSRRATPRPRVPAGAVAVAGGFLGIYPFATPGGWNLLGRALVSPFAGGHARFRAGDHIQLRVVPDGAAPAPEPETAREGEATLVVHGTSPAFVQDLGRPGRLAEAVPIGGALVREGLRRANRLAGAADDAPAIERFGPMTLEALGFVRVATDDGELHRLSPGERVTLGWAREKRVGYVAIDGGLDVPEVLGGFGTHVSVGLGGLAGRALRRGDRLHRGGRHATPVTPTAQATAPFPSPRLIRLVPGPDAPGALDTLLASTFTIAIESDRTGVRLTGPALPAPTPTRSVPMFIGAIELPPSGAPIVLGPDHPTTGGYPVVAVVRDADLDLLFGAPVGGAVRFVLG